MSKKKIKADLIDWFNNRHVYGVVVYQRPGFKTKIALAAENEFHFKFLATYTGGKMPATGQPNNKWKDARIIGTAQILEYALQLMDCVED